MKKIIVAIVIIVIVAAAVVAIIAGGNNNNDNVQQSNNSNNSTSQPVNQNSSSSQSATAANEVNISNFAFSPATITVKKGTTVTWTNNDSVAHTVTADSGNGPDSATLSAGQTYSFRFNSTGTFNYHCSIHPEMHGTVTVTE